MASASLVSCGFLAQCTPGRTRLDALCLRLRDLGGASVARTFTHALDRLLKAQDSSSSPERWEKASGIHGERRKGGEAGGEVAAAAVGGEAGVANGRDRDGAFREAAAAAKVVVDVAWEKLHTGDWKDADEAWRELYVLGALLRVSATLKLAERASSPTETAVGDTRQGAPGAAGAAGAAGPMTPAEALRALDMAALLGGPQFREELEAAIARVQATVTRGDLENDADDDDAHDGGGSWRLGDDGGGGGGESVDEGGTRAASVLPPGSLLTAAAAATEHFPGGPVPRLDSPPSLETFYCDHMIAGENGCGAPVVICGAMSHWPALRRWRVGRRGLRRRRRVTFE